MKIDNLESKLMMMILILAAGFAVKAAAGTDMKVDAPKGSQDIQEQLVNEAKEYTKSLEKMSLGELTSETGINLGLTVAQCGSDMAMGIVGAISNSARSQELIEALSKIEKGSKCQISSLRLSFSAKALKERSTKAFEAFQRAAAGKRD